MESSFDLVYVFFSFFFSLRNFPKLWGREIVSQFVTHHFHPPVGNFGQIAPFSINIISVFILFLYKHQPSSQKLAQGTASEQNEEISTKMTSVCAYPEKEVKKKETKCLVMAETCIWFGMCWLRWANHHSWQQGQIQSEAGRDIRDESRLGLQQYAVLNCSRWASQFDTSARQTIYSADCTIKEPIHHRIPGVKFDKMPYLAESLLNLDSLSWLIHSGLKKSL